MSYTFDNRLIRLIDIDEVVEIEHVNGIDLEVEEDQTFTLADGIISHNSAAKSLFAARGKNPYIGTFPLKGKVLNVREKDIARVLGLDKKKEREKEGKKTEPNEIQKILTLIGLKIGVPVETIPKEDGEWVELEIDGKKMVVNENDNIEINGKSVRVADLL
jgi:hypothetical protein